MRVDPSHTCGVPQKQLLIQNRAGLRLLGLLGLDPSAISVGLPSTDLANGACASDPCLHGARCVVGAACCCDLLSVSKVQ